MKGVFIGSIIGSLLFGIAGGFIGAILGYYISKFLSSIVIVVNKVQADYQQQARNAHAQYQEYARQQRAGQRSQSFPNFSSSNSALSKAYEVLGVPETSSLDEIRKAYRSKCKVLHPDTLKSKNLHPDVISTLEKELRQVVEAYELILKSRT